MCTLNETQLLCILCLRQNRPRNNKHNQYVLFFSCRQYYFCWLAIHKEEMYGYSHIVLPISLIPLKPF